MSLKCLIIDDDPVMCDLVEAYCKKIDRIQYLLKVHDGNDALTLLTTQEFDLVFLDLHLPGSSGREILEFLPPKTPVIIITSDPDFAVEAFQFNVLGYLVKPFSFAQFLKAVNKISSSPPPESGEPAHFFVKDGGKLVKIHLEELSHVKSESNYVTFHLKDRKVMSLLKMSELMEELPANFVRVHRSYIINIDFIDGMEKNAVMMKGERIPVSESYREGLLEKIQLL